VFSKRIRLAATAAVLGVAGFSAAAVAGGGREFETDLNGFEEVPSVSTFAGGDMSAEIDRAGSVIRYVLSWRNLEALPTQAHIHLGQEDAAGGISVWLCDSASNPSPRETTPACPQMQTATVDGEIRAADVVGPANQGIAGGEFNELVRAMRAGVTYANVHSQKFGPGEIRGQFERNHGDRDSNDN
jgi:hypothetical protein